MKRAGGLVAWSSVSSPEELERGSPGRSGGSRTSSSARVLALVVALAVDPEEARAR